MKKQTKKYYFSVEGESEKWYLQHCQELINNEERLKYKVKFDIKVEKNPVSRVKGLTQVDKVKIIHMCDREGTSKEQTQVFQDTLDKMKNAEKMGKRVRYILAYSNLSFELWMILHMMDCNGKKINCDSYLPLINRAFNRSFPSLKEYKKENNFKRILNQIELYHVLKAVERAKTITHYNEICNYEEKQYGKYKYYDENPSTNLGEIIGNILNECGIGNRASGV